MTKEELENIKKYLLLCEIDEEDNEKIINEMLNEILKEEHTDEEEQHRI